MAGIALGKAHRDGITFLELNRWPAIGLQIEVKDHVISPCLTEMVKRRGGIA